MKNKIFIFLPILFGSLCLSACGGSGNSRGRDDLKLQFFGLPNTRNDKKMRFLNNESAEMIQLDNDFDKKRLEIVVKNDNRYSFIDLVILNKSNNVQYVFNEGNGSYTCSSITTNSGDQWETIIEINVSNYFIDLEHKDGAISYLEIKELNFINFSNNVEKADLNTEEIRTATFCWKDSVTFYGESPNRVVSDVNLIKKLNSTESTYGSPFAFNEKRYVKVLGDKHGWGIARFGNYQNMVPGTDYFFQLEAIAWDIVSRDETNTILKQQYALPYVDTYKQTLSDFSYSIVSEARIQASDYMIAIGESVVWYRMESEPTLGFCENVHALRLTIASN